MKAHLFVLPVLFVLSCGCADTNRVVTDSTRRPKTTHVDIFKVFEGEKPSQPVRSIAELSRKGIASDELPIESYFVSEARKMGADAIAVEREQVGSHLGWGPFGGGGISGASLNVEFLYKAKLYVYEH